MMETRIKDFEVARISIAARREYLPAIGNAVRAFAEQFLMNEKEIFQLELMVEEACLNVIEHAFEPDETGSLDVVIERKPGKIVIGIEDQGLPFDFNKVDPNSESGLGMLLIRSFADQVSYLNLGRKGKRVEIIKSLAYKGIENYVSPEEKESSKELPQAPADAPLTYSMMTADQCIDLARCVYRSYGYSYPNDTIYFPEKRRELLESGILESCVVLNEQQEIIGHLSMAKNTPDAKVGESGQAVVDPRYRGRSLFKDMKIYLSDYVKKKGMYGLYSEAVSVHPFTQKGNLSLGAHETGFLLAYAPANMHFKKIRETEQKTRQSTVLFYHKINEEPHREIYLPIYHKTIIKKIYENLKLNRSFPDVVPLKSYDEEAVIDVKVLPDFGFAYLTVVRYGYNFADLLEFRFRELLKKRIDCIYTDLPLSDPATPHYCASAEKLGFFFSGVIPELFDGDVFRLQYLNNVEVIPADICVASDFGRELLTYILNEYKLGV